MRIIKWGLTFVFSLISLASIFILILLVMDYKQNPEIKTEENIEGIENKEGKKEIELNPFRDDIAAKDMKDENFIRYIHGMSHQKVATENEEKWYFYIISDVRINWLLEALELVEVEHYLLYKKILTRWAEGDFSHAVDDHNRLWDLEDGSEGRAIRLFTEEEEKEYIKTELNSMVEY